MTTWSDRRPENLIKLDGSNQCRLTSEDRACGFHQGQSEQSLTNRPVIVTQSDRLTSTLQLRGSPYSSGCAARIASVTNRRLGTLCAL